MRRALPLALLCAIGAGAAAQETPVSFEEPQPVTVTGFAVGRLDYDRLDRSNSFTAGKIALSLFKPVGDAYLFGQLTAALDNGETAIEIDNLVFSWTPQAANRWTVAFGKFDAPIGFERDDEPLNFLPTNSFNFSFARPGKLTGVAVQYTASPTLSVWGMAANGWDRDVDNNRGKTGLLRAELLPAAGLSLGVTGVYGPERDSTDAFQRSLLSADVTLERGRLIVGAEVNLGREQAAPAPTWRGASATAFVRLSPRVGVTARVDQLEDRGGALTGASQVLRSLTVGPMWHFSSAREGVFSNVEHTSFHLPQIAVRAALRVDRSSRPFFPGESGPGRSDTRGVLELFYVF
ncbi:MAG TPA: porin [Gemmatimonadales bacterium]|nr:porin [Gemmatimonadales bacterium]